MCEIVRVCFMHERVCENELHIKKRHKGGERFKTVSHDSPSVSSCIHMFCSQSTSMFSQFSFWGQECSLCAITFLGHSCICGA